MTIFPKIGAPRRCIFWERATMRLGKLTKQSLLSRIAIGWIQNGVVHSLSLPRCARSAAIFRDASLMPKPRYQSREQVRGQKMTPIIYGDRMRSCTGVCFGWGKKKRRADIGNVALRLHHVIQC